MDRLRWNGRAQGAVASPFDGIATGAWHYLGRRADLSRVVAELGSVLDTDYHRFAAVYQR